MWQLAATTIAARGVAAATTLLPLLFCCHTNMCGSCQRCDSCHNFAATTILLPLLFVWQLPQLCCHYYFAATTLLPLLFCCHNSAATTIFCCHNFAVTTILLPLLFCCHNYCAVIMVFHCSTIASNEAKRA